MTSIIIFAPVLFYRLLEMVAHTACDDACDHNLKLKTFGSRAGAADDRRKMSWMVRKI